MDRLTKATQFQRRMLQVNGHTGTSVSSVTPLITFTPADVT